MTDRADPYAAASSRRDESGFPPRPDPALPSRVAPLFGLAPGGVCRARPVTRPAGELLPHRFTLTSAGPARAAPAEAVYSLWHFPYRSHIRTWLRRWALPTTAPCGVRTFLRGMSPGRPIVPVDLSSGHIGTTRAPRRSSRPPRTLTPSYGHPAGEQASLSPDGRPYLKDDARPERFELDTRASPFRCTASFSPLWKATCPADRNAQVRHPQGVPRTGHHVPNRSPHLARTPSDPCHRRFVLLRRHSCTVKQCLCTEGFIRSEGPCHRHVRRARGARISRSRRIYTARRRGRCGAGGRGTLSSARQPRGACRSHSGARCKASPGWHRASPGSAC